MGDSYVDKIERCKKWIAFFEENPDWRELAGVLTGKQRAEDAAWRDADQLIAIERRKIAMLQRYAALEA